MKQTLRLDFIHSVLNFTTRFQVQIEEELRAFDITLFQFQILNLLYDVKPMKLAVKDIRKQMSRRTSDFTRIVDRLVDKGLVDRFECPKDRRIVEVSITRAGSKLINNLNESLTPVADEWHQIIQGQIAKMNDSVVEDTFIK